MITHAVTSALRGRSLRLLSLITFFFLFLCHATYSQASLLKERDLDFVVNETMLGRGYTQISSLATLPENLRSASASFSEMDFAKVANEPNSMLLIVKFAFFVNKRVDFYSKENIFSKLEFEKISHNTTVLRENRLSANKIVFDIKKKVSLFSIKSKMDVEHYDKEELEGSPYKTIAT
ncbi:MAG: hypothetical protein HYW48_03420, partial [Deltaproteobacteria bacterium]|nr:hypothetical protein [Deltaproteobacteria bacterium]